MAKVGVLGAGSWGTALSVLLHDNGHQVTIWSIDGNEVKMLDEKREHELKLPGVKLAEDMVITGDLETAVRGKDFLVLAVPSPFTRETARKMKPYVADGQIIVDARLAAQLPQAAHQIAGIQDQQAGDEAEGIGLRVRRQFQLDDRMGRKFYPKLLRHYPIQHGKRGGGFSGYAISVFQPALGEYE